MHACRSAKAVKPFARIAAWWALVWLAPAGATGQVIRAENKPTPQGPSATVGVHDSSSSVRTELERMIRGCKRHMTKAEKLFAEGKYGPACRSLASAKHLAITADLFSRWARLAGQLQQIGKERFDAAEQRYARCEYVEALAEFRRIAVIFTGLPVAEAARKCFVDARSDPEVQAAIKEAKAARLFGFLKLLLRPRTSATSRPATRPAAPKVTADAVTALEDADFLRAIDTLDNIVRSCPDTPTANKADAIVRQVRADPTTAARLASLMRTRKADQALNKARTYHQA
ncbi:MAG: hypothetical protein ACYS5V_04220, partial [Planctomycetota bacterium]